MIGVVSGADAQLTTGGTMPRVDLLDTLDLNGSSDRGRNSSGSPSKNEIGRADKAGELRGPGHVFRRFQLDDPTGASRIVGMNSSDPSRPGVFSQPEQPRAGKPGDRVVTFRKGFFPWGTISHREAHHHGPALVKSVLSSATPFQRADLFKPSHV